MVFKDREKYIEGEFRFRRAPSRHNPRKLIKIWAEKEYRNLSRIVKSEIPCPKPIVIKTNVLVMEFIGNDMVAAPRLKNTNLDFEEYTKLYKKCILYTRVLY